MTTRREVTVLAALTAAMFASGCAMTAAVRRGGDRPAAGPVAAWPADGQAWLMGDAPTSPSPREGYYIRPPGSARFHEADLVALSNLAVHQTGVLVHAQSTNMATVARLTATETTNAAQQALLVLVQSTQATVKATADAAQVTNAANTASIEYLTTTSGTHTADIEAAGATNAEQTASIEYLTTTSATHTADIEAAGVTNAAQEALLELIQSTQVTVKATADAAYLIVTNGPMRPIAWVSTNGNNATATLGNPLKPYASPWVAWSNGAGVLIMGPGTFPGLTAPGATVDVTIVGHRTTIGEVNLRGDNETARNGGRLTIKGNGAEHVRFSGTLFAVCGDQTGLDETPGGTGGVIRASGIDLSGMQLVAAHGGTGGETSGDAGPAGQIHLTDCIGPLNELSTLGGLGYGGAGGAPGSIYLTNCLAPSPIKSGHQGGVTVSGSGAITIVGGRAGTVWLSDDTGANGISGTITAMDAEIGTIAVDDPGAGESSVTLNLSRVISANGIGAATATFSGSGRLCDITTSGGTPGGISWTNSCIDGVQWLAGFALSYDGTNVVVTVP